MRKSYPPTGFEPATFELLVHCFKLLVHTWAREDVYTGMLNFGYLNPATCLLYDVNNYLINVNNNKKSQSITIKLLLVAEDAVNILFEWRFDVPLQPLSVLFK